MWAWGRWESRHDGQTQRACSVLTWSIMAASQKLASPNLSRMVQECLLEEAVQQKQVLETLLALDFEKVSKATSIDEGK